MTGKTSLLERVKHAAFFNLLDPEVELKFRANPKLFHEELAGLKPRSTV